MNIECDICKEEIVATPYYELHEWFRDEYGSLICTSDFYCNKCIGLKMVLKK